MTATLITNGFLIDGTGAKPGRDMSIFVVDNRIAKTGPAAEVKAFADGQGPHTTIDATGRTIMPGLIDCHVHISYGDILSIEALKLYNTPEYGTLKAALAARKVLRAGVTSMACPGGNWNTNVAIRDAVASGLIEGPRTSAGGHYLATWNSTGLALPSHIENPPSSNAIACNTTDDFVAKTRREIKDGVDIIKISGDGDVTTWGGGDLLGCITYTDMKAAAEIAHLMDKRITVHARSGRSSADAARAGFDWLIHGSYMNDEQLSVVIDHQTPINPTLSLLANSLDWGPDFGLSPRILESYKRELDAAANILTKAYTAGITILAGTDSGQTVVPYGAWHARELEHLMSYLGMSAMDAILAGTRNAAMTLPFGHEVGTLEEGKLADLLVVDGDPLADITVLQDPERLEVIMKDGAVVDTGAPLPEPTTYAWEVPMVMWADPRLPDQAFVRDHAKHKPAWMKKAAKAAE